MPSPVRSLGLALLLVACSGGHDGLAAMLPGTTYGAYNESGLASWYGDEVAGNRTASGDRFEPDGITAAHRTLPLNSYVEVTNIGTGRSIIARINDRGPGRRDRIIDLSRGATHMLGTDRFAVANVRVRAVAPSSPIQAAEGAGRSAVYDQPAAPVPDAFPHSPSGRYVVQAASFSSQARAEALADRLGGAIVPAHGLWRVQIGPYASSVAAQRARDAVAARGYGDARILPAD